MVLKKENMKDQGLLFNKKEIFNFLKLEKAMCKIKYEKIEKNIIKKGQGTGFFCQIDNFPIKYALFTGNHILDENDIRIGNIINIEYNNEVKTIKIDEKRRVFTDKEFNYTCIELYGKDGINDFFIIDPSLFTGNKNYLLRTDILILEYPINKGLCFFLEN